MKKILILPLIALMFIVCSMGIASAHVGHDNISVTFDFPKNGSTLLNNTWTTQRFNITLNESVNKSCEAEFNSNGTWIEMTATAATNVSYYFDFTSSTLTGDWQAVIYRCGNVTGFKSYSNFTDSVLYYKLSNAVLAPLNRAFLNNSIIARNEALNVTTGSLNASNCTYQLDGGVGRVWLNQTGLMTRTGGWQWWTNTSEMALSNTTFGTNPGTYHNITFNCSNSIGTWYSSDTIFFKVDAIQPTILYSGMAYTLGNATTGGNYLNVTFNITDNNPSRCYLKLRWGSDNSFKNVSSWLTYDPTQYITSSTNNTANGVCKVSILPTDVTKDGYVEVVPSAQDEAGNGNSTTLWNQSYIFYRMKTGWNLVAGFENKSLTAIGNEFKNVTYVSVWDNLANMKNFTTWTFGGSTNGATIVNFSTTQGSGGTYIYVSADIVSIRRYYDMPVGWSNVSLYSNTSVGKTTWNMVAINRNITNINASLFSNVACTNLTYEITNQSINFAANDTDYALGYYALSIISIKNRTHIFYSSNYTGGSNWTVSTNLSYIRINVDGGNIIGVYNVSYIGSLNLVRACNNITWVSWYNVQLGKPCSFFRNRLATSCPGYLSNSISVDRGDAIWIAIQNGVNITFDRSKW